MPRGGGPRTRARGELAIRPLTTADVPWAEALLDRELAGRHQARLGALVDALDGPGIVALGPRARPVGLLTWLVGGPGSAADEAEIQVVVVEPAARGTGVGSALLDAAEAELERGGVRRAWLVTTNDNLAALDYYQRRGWRLERVLPGAVDEARRSLKPGIPRVAGNGISMRDELVLTREL
jgi:ribosomal protein S18 acetylase RimI-like enzyme